MKKIILLGTGLLIAGGIFFTFSCNKPTLDTNTQTAQDNNLCENEFMRILPAINVLAISHFGAGVERTTGTHYPVITATDTTKSPGWPRTLTINYGPGVADSSDGKTRSGMIIVSFSNYWHDIGTVATVTLSNYFVGGTNYSGTLSIERISATQFKQSVVNGVCTASNWKIMFASSRTFTWTGGYNDTVPSHSQYIITGSAQGTDRNQVNFTSSITSALVKRNNCPSICQGTIEITPAGLANRTVDFGNGTCSGKATVTINGQSQSIGM